VHVPRRLGHRHRSRKFISTAAHEDLLAVDRWLERRRLTGDGEFVQVTLYIELAYRSRADPVLPRTETVARSLARTVDPGFAFIRIMSMPSTVCLACSRSDAGSVGQENQGDEEFGIPGRHGSAI
jgi:hypothetical protein